MSEWEDRVAINDVLARYCDGVNLRDAAIWAASWDVDGEWFLFGPEPVRGRDAIVAAWQEAMAGFPFAVMFAAPGTIEIDGDQAQGRSYTNEVVKTAEGIEMRVTGMYEDRYVRRDGRWGFAHRRFTVLHTETL